MKGNRSTPAKRIKAKSTTRSLTNDAASRVGRSNSILSLNTLRNTTSGGVIGNSFRQMSEKPAEVSSTRLTKRRYVELSSNNLLEATSKAGGDIYAPLTYHKKFEDAARLLPDFKDVLNHPMPSAGRKKQIVNDFFKQIGADNTTNEFFQTLAVDGRLSLANDILTNYRKKAAHHNKDTLATVTSAAPLSKAEMDQVVKGLTPHVPKGYKLQLIPKVDPSVLGGVIVQSDDFYQDLSLATAYKALEAEVEASVNIQ